jgi:hypothetical protein
MIDHKRRKEIGVKTNRGLGIGADIIIKKLKKLLNRPL